MTVSNSTFQNTYTGDGVTTIFPYTFRVVEPVSLQVFLAGIQISTSLWSQQPNLTGIGGTATFKTAPPVGSSVLIQRISDLQQNVALGYNEPLAPGTLEGMADKLTIIAQQLLAAIGNGLSAPLSAVGFNGVLPSPLVIGGILAVNAALNGLTYISPVSSRFVLMDNGPGAMPSFQNLSVLNGSYVIATPPVAAGYALTDNGPSATPTFQPPGSGFLTTKGDILTSNGTTPVRQPIGTNGNALVADSTQANGLAWETTIPFGGCIMWPFSIATIPSGWYLCNGQTTPSGKVTPNLQGMFTMGAGAGATPNPNGFGIVAPGAQFANVDHSHTYSGSGVFNSGGNIGTQGVTAASTQVASNGHVHSTTVAWSGTTSGSSGTSAPSYYAVCWIMKG